MKNAIFLFGLFSLSFLFTNCSSDDTGDFFNDIDNNPDNPVVTQNFLDDRGLPENVTHPSDNPTSFAKVELGRLLFYDPILSGEEDVSCATCHHPQFGYADGRELPIGVGGVGLGPNRFDAVNDDIGLVGRNSPTVINTAFNGIRENGNVNPANAPMFWDNRANSLEEQALGPIQNFEEMRGHAFGEDVALNVIVNRLRDINEYENRFQDVFGGNPAITSENIGKAIAAFERAIVANNSPFDRYARGDENALTQQQIRGLQRFDQVGCNDCHSGPMFSDYDLHVLGVPDNNDLNFSDDGANGTYAFRTPTLRNLGVTGPYFHNGVADDLQDVMNFYRRISGNGGGGGGNGGPGNLNINQNVNPNQIANDARRLDLNQNDVQDIIAFLNALNDNSFDQQIPNSVPSGLNVGGNID